MTVHKAALYYPALTGIRAIAAVMVFFYHVVQNIPTGDRSFAAKWAIRLVQQGHIGVIIFFVLSGFLITARYFNRLELSGPWFCSYLQNRFARIYPIYFLLTAFAFAVMLAAPTYTWYEWPRSFVLSDKLAAIFLNLTLTRAFFQDLVPLGVPTAWTLTVEETFYLSAPFLLLGLKRNPRLLLLYPVALLGIGALLVAVLAPLNLPWGFMESTNLMLSRTFFGCCIPFLVGIGLALWMNQRPKQPASSWGKATVVGSLVVLLGIVLSAYFEHSQPQVNLWVNNLLTFPVAILFWGLIVERTWLQQILSSKPFDLLGKSSYVFYLIHMGAVDTLLSNYVSMHWFVRLVGHTLLSIALYKWVEHPLHLKLRAKPKKAESVLA